MPRPREFEPDEALDAVMHVFWKKGFAETSYEDLVLASGVSRKSLYTVFGDKEALFIASLRLYRQTVFKSILSGIEQEAITIDDIIRVLKNLGLLAISDAGSTGCFMANTASDEILQIPEVKDQVNAHLKSMSKIFYDALKRAGIQSDRAAMLADYLTGVLQGLFVLAHARAEKTLIENYIDSAIAIL